jgi:hypothetical protein
MSFQGGKQVKRSGECETVYNVYKFIKTASEVGITIPLQSCRTVTEATRVSTRILCSVLKEGENVETGVAMAFSTPHKLRPKV